MDQVKIRAVVAAGGLPKGREVTVAATPMVEGAISNGVFQELERYPSPAIPEGMLDALTRKVEEQPSALVDELTDETPDDVTPVPPIRDVELPDPPKPKAPRSRG